MRYFLQLTRRLFRFLWFFLWLLFLMPSVLAAPEINHYVTRPKSRFILSPEYRKMSPDQKEEIITVLTIDGGGMYGIIPLKILADLEKRTQLHTSTLFDVMGGASTGSIIISSLAIPGDEGHPRYTAKDVLAMYEKNASRIFQFKIGHSIKTLFGLYGPIFSRDNIDKIILSQLGNYTITDLLTEVIIPCGLLMDYSPFLFSSLQAKKNDDFNFYIKDAVLSATATPDLFAPFELENYNKNWSDYGFDSGIYSNNPTMQILLELHQHYPKKKFFVVSLGTHIIPESKVLKDAKNFNHIGIINGIFPIIETGMAFSTRLTAFDVDYLSSLNSKILMGYVRIDNASQLTVSPFTKNKSEIDEINQTAKDLIDKIHPTLEALANVLLEMNSGHNEDAMNRD